ncbi:MAG: PocR ligand-binding domain-containing protein [Candidatus Omnitrophota bacterium]
MAPRFAKLEELIYFEDWQKIQDSFADTFGLSLSTVDVKGAQLFRKSKPLDLCGLLPDDLPGYVKFNGQWLVKKEFNLSPRGLTSANGPCNLKTFFFPIKTFGRNVIAFMAVGPLIIDKREDRSFYAGCAEDMGAPPGALSDLLAGINVFPHSEMRKITVLMESVFAYIARTSYHNKRLGQISREMAKVDPLFSRTYEQKVLSSLLNACKVALDVESGSVMTIDKFKHLHIMVSSKLNKDIVNNSDQKVGEGIAGKAADAAEPILLPKDSGKGDILKDMKRSSIKSSMIVPFNKAISFETYGVLNLNILRKGRKFSQKDIDLTKELVSMASLALSLI